MLAVVLVLCCGGGAGVYLLVKDEVTDVVEATQTRLVTPDTLAGRPKSTRTSFQQIADAQVASLKRTNPGATSSISAFYGESAKKDLIMIAGVSGIVADPNRALDDMIKTLVSDLGLTNIQSIDPGPLGGNAKCGDGNMAEYPVGVCVWVDRGSLGMIFAYEQTAEEIKAEFVTIRGEVQKRG
ncbi:MAG TPA: hypothetical protein VFX61_06405 [Micromonosporaceae bacterium]|nr:hypothetical protein [Micromonosporaceae bacterium]